jgi:GR25 family glycosyltransferase involved in LPS biosynthesis
MLTDSIEKIYIIHYKPLVDRKNYLINYFQENNITNYEFRDLYQREELTEEIKNNYYTPDNINLNPAQICITIEHIETYKKIVETCKDENKWFLILEDDARFYHEFIDKLNFYMKNIPEDAEYIDICDFCTINTNELWYKTIHTRTTCSYLIKKSTCEKVLTTIIPFIHAIDHQMNMEIKNHNLNVYWSNDSLVNHGSLGTYNNSYAR